MEDVEAHIMEGSSSNLEEEDDGEEALSLCDLPLNQDSSSKRNSLDDKSLMKFVPPPLQDATEFFEFFNGFGSSSDMCPADDIFSCGKLVPFKGKNFITEAKISPATHRRRSESLSSVTVTRSNSVSVSTSTTSRRLMMRNSRSLDYRRLHDVTVPEVSARSVVPSEIGAKKATKPRWYSLVFGTMKVPPEMELNDIKNRQVRRNPSTTMFPATDHHGKVAVNRCSGKVSWRILKALSCKDHASVAVTTSFPLQQAS